MIERTGFSSNFIMQGHIQRQNANLYRHQGRSQGYEHVYAQR